MKKKTIENVMAGSSVFMSWNRSSGSDPADFADNSILAGGILFVLQEDRKDFTSGLWGRSFTKIIWTAL